MSEELRAQIVAEIMSLVRPAPVALPKPTIEELEKILNSEPEGIVSVNPDGSVSVVPTKTTVGDVADAILRIVTPEIERLRAGLKLLIEEITDLEGREGLTDYEFAEQVIALAHQQREALLTPHIAQGDAK